MLVSALESADEQINTGEAQSGAEDRIAQNGRRRSKMPPSMAMQT
ncbi:hypothetical protein GL4_1182 [Methyloceanibacter caenitepidi]|uniref:Uncharacterized protein n=1 Tax=Methyloceanibacter caenitepidi TaxID=1384459 RepID=A0A0A8K143_9HYPH|nr:hypothetical protein GL4_1182 [Methyloceanibacter caenitepidi]